MTIKEYFVKKVKEEFDEKCEEIAKEEPEHKSQLLFSWSAVCYIMSLFIAIVFICKIIECVYGYAIVLIILSIIHLIVGILLSIECRESKRKIPDIHAIKNNYITKQVNKYMNSISSQYFNYQHDESITLYKVTLRLFFDGNFIEYSESDNSIRFSVKGKFNQPIKLDKIVGYKLIDEGHIICSNQKANVLPYRKFINNSFKCNKLDLNLYISDEERNSVLEYTLLAYESRANSVYKNTIEFFKCVFAQIDALLINEVPNTPENSDEISVTKEPATPYDRLVTLKKLYEEGIIDQQTYEEKKKKLIDEL